MDVFAPRISIRQSPIATNHVTIVGVQSSSGQKKSGPNLAPPVVLSDKFLNEIQHLGWNAQVVFVGDGEKERIADRETNSAASQGGKLYHVTDVVRINDAVLEACITARRRLPGTLPLILGGDHALVMGSIAASVAAHPDVCVLWFDAHADINTPFNSPSGNIHGMPLSFLCGLPGTEKFPELAKYRCLKLSSLGYLGLRSVDDGEQKLFSDHPEIAVTTMADINTFGFAYCVRKVLHKLNPNRERPVHLSFDVDGMDPSEAPSTGTRERGGVMLHEALSLIRHVRDQYHLVGVDVMEVNPAIGSSTDVGVTVRNARWVIAEILGRLPQRQKL